MLDILLHKETEENRKGSEDSQNYFTKENQFKAIFRHFKTGF